MPSPSAIFGDGPVSARDNGPADRIVCPYCGLVSARADASGACSRCTIEDTPQTRQATKARIGPWYVLQNRNPAAPGMKWTTLLALVKKGQVTPRSVVRGPTTHQLWRLASQVKGLSREFGICYSCGLDIARTANQCPHCDRLQEPPANPDVLLEARDLPVPAPKREPAAIADFDPPSPAAAPPAGNALVARAQREGRPDGGILTARELATAFQLDLQTSDGSQVPATVAPASPRRPRRFGRIVLLLLLMSLIGLGALVWFTPGYREVAEGYWEQGRDWMTRSWQSWRAAPVEKDADASEDSLPGLADAGMSPPSDSPVTPDASAARREPEIQRVETRDTASPPSVVVIDPQALIEQSRSLRRAAIDAEAAGDFARAVRLYEQIRNLPREYWPSDLQVRLDAAKQRAR